MRNKRTTEQQLAKSPKVTRVLIATLREDIYKLKLENKNLRTALRRISKAVKSVT